MGTWGAGPFANDGALDYVGSVIDFLMKPVDAFVASPEIDETFDPAFAAIELLNEVMRVTPSRPYRREGFDPAPMSQAMISCFDEQIDGMGPDEEFKAEQRAALVSALETFVAFTKR